MFITYALAKTRKPEDIINETEFYVGEYSK
jgi:hypothetical protein